MSGQTSVAPVQGTSFPKNEAWVQPLLAWRTRYSFGKFEALVLALYTAVIGFTLPFHEPWMDEAQAWLITRDLSFSEVLRHRLHYEGHPALWYGVVHLLQLAHVPWAAAGYFGALFAVAGVFVWLRWSPFPLIVRVLLPFTFFLQYQYAVVFRSYTMFPVLLFALCALYTAGRKHVIAFAAVAGLLANLCLQGTLVAGIFAVLYAWDAHRERRQGDLRQAWGAGAQDVSMRRWVAGGAALVFACVAAVATALPAPDQSGIVPFPFGTHAGHKFLEDVVGEAPGPKYEDPAFNAFYLAIQDHPPMPRSASFRDSPEQWFTHQLSVPRSRKSLRNLPWTLAGLLVSAPRHAMGPVSESYLLGGAFYLLLLVWAIRRRGLRYFLSALAFLAAGDTLTRGPHHAGLLLLTFLAGVWITAKRPLIGRHAMAGTWHSLRWSEPLLIAVMAVVFAVQVEWAGHAVLGDWRGLYDPGKETAKFLHTLPAGTRMASFDEWAVSIQPYFPSDPFFNLTSSSWTWRSDGNINYNHRAVLDSRPPIVVVSSETEPPSPDPWLRVENSVPENPILVDLRAHGYVATHRFCGDRFAQSGVSHEVCDTIFAPADQRQYASR